MTVARTRWALGGAILAPIGLVVTGTVMGARCPPRTTARAREPVRSGPGHFQVNGPDLALDDEWTHTIRVEPDRFTEETATLGFRMG